MSKRRKNDEYSLSGFGKDRRLEGGRLVNKDGTFNVIKKGLAWRKRFGVFNFLIEISWGRFFVVCTFFYLIMNLCFTGVYMALGVDGIGAPQNDEMGAFWKAFFFSTHTSTTVGYGSYYPHSMGIQAFASIQSMIGLLGFALMTGILYGRFSKPKASIVYSKNAIIAPYKDGNGLMIRLANAQNSQMLEMAAAVMVALVEDGKRRFYDLKLEYNRIHFLATSWTIVHPLDEDSPIFGMTQNDYMNKEIEFIIRVKGYNDTFAQEVHSATSYKSYEVLWDKKFVPIIGVEDDMTYVELDQLSTFSDPK